MESITLSKSIFISLQISNSATGYFSKLIDSVLSYILVEALLKFRLKIEHYVKLNKDKTDLGVTHMHYQDYDKKARESATDIVFYVDLNTYKK